MSAEQWQLNHFRDELWNSGLCSDHKLVGLGVVSYMGKHRPLAYPGHENLGKRVSMSRTKLSRLVQDLVAYGWLDLRAMPEELRRPGRSPNCFYLPYRDVLPQVPEHCLKKPRLLNLKRLRK